MQQARELAAVGEMTAALTIVRALIAREPTHMRARAGARGAARAEGRRRGRARRARRAHSRSTPDDVPKLCSRAALYIGARQVRPGRGGPAARGEGRRPERRRAGAARRAVLQARALARGDRAAARGDRAPIRSCAAAHYHLGDAYNSIDDLPAALARVRGARRSSSRRTLRALKRIGVVLDRLGRPAEAAAAYQRARAAQRR